MKKIRNCLVWLIVFALKLITVPFFFFGWIFIAILTFFHWVIDLLSTREDEEFLISSYLIKTTSFIGKC